MLWLWPILLACSDAPPPAKPRLAAQRSQVPEAKKPGLDAPIVAPEDPSFYEGRWLVILSSKTDPGFVPEGLEHLYSLRTQPAPARLSSSHYKGLMPCFEIVIAHSFEDWRGARDYIDGLERLGVEAYTKNAGEYVGEDPRVSRYCEAEEPPTCGDVHMVRDIDGEPWMALSLDDVLTSRAAVDAPPAYSMNRDLSAWGAPLASENIGPYSKGQVWRWFNRGEDFQCAISKFGLLTLGTPHFGYSQLDDLPTEPGCGSPQVYAHLTCDGGAVGEGFAVQGAPPEWVQRIENEESSNLPGMAMLAAENDPGFDALRKTAAERAGAEPLDDEVSVELYSSGRRLLAAVRYRGWTGEGSDECGGDDVDVHGFSLVDMGGRAPKLVVAPHESEVEVLGVWYRKGQLEYALRSWPDETTVYTADGEASCGLSIPFCDCPC